MKKIQGSKSDYAPLKREGTQIIVSYGYEEIGENEATWFEVSLPKNQYPTLTFPDVRDAILGDIDSQTDEKILTGFQWTLTKGWKQVDGQKVDMTGETVSVWLSNENQMNYSEGHSIAKEHPEQFLPMTYKVSEDDEKRAIYEDFEDYATLDRFYLSAAAFKKATLNDGWARKISIDWSEYTVYFPVKTE